MLTHCSYRNNVLHTKDNKNSGSNNPENNFIMRKFQPNYIKNKPRATKTLVTRVNSIAD